MQEAFSGIGDPFDRGQVDENGETLDGKLQRLRSDALPEEVYTQADAIFKREGIRRVSPKDLVAMAGTLHREEGKECEARIIFIKDVARARQMVINNAPILFRILKDGELASPDIVNIFFADTEEIPRIFSSKVIKAVEKFQRQEIEWVLESCDVYEERAEKGDVKSVKADSKILEMRARLLKPREELLVRARSLRQKLNAYVDVYSLPKKAVA